MGALESETLSASSRAFISPGADPLGPVRPSSHASDFDRSPRLTGRLHGAVALLVSYPHGLILTGNRFGHTSTFNYKPRASCKTSGIERAGGVAGASREALMLHFVAL